MCANCGCHSGSVTVDGELHPNDARRVIALERDLLEKNSSFAAINRKRLQAAGCLAVNLMSSPGAGKTTLLISLIKALNQQQSITVIEGDQATATDANRIRATGVKAVQINTGKGCHLDAEMVGRALDVTGIPAGGILFIENVGNLVCPAAFDLGESKKAVVVSVAQGEDKPLKYPEMFNVADLLLVNKVDLLPYLDVDHSTLIANARRVNPSIRVIDVSATRGTGVKSVVAWLAANQMPPTAAT